MRKVKGCFVLPPRKLFSKNNKMVGVLLPTATKVILEEWRVEEKAPATA